MGVSETDVIYNYVGWNGTSPERSVMRNRVHSKDWHTKMQQLKLHGRSEKAVGVKLQATLFAKAATTRWGKLFPALA